MSTDLFDWTPEDRPRLWEAWLAMYAKLDAVGDWVSREDLVSEALDCFKAEPEMAPKRATMLAMLATASRRGALERWPANAKRAKYGARKFRVPRLDS